ncbi:lantibiotic dehydratase [Fulvivirga sediminis]|uniref:Lantibiotic dehydratase n=1 Tax=Fulvivirga sediminis TaxID=2803949 RepID=A0A937K159_9BACT|nr:lantibiotic dehydratase [Fulvivirga sediminis]MBL3657010.1 lantibiotic dehydratase [Fulvivirga sediminis]
MQLFSKALVRIGGASYEEWESFSFPGLVNLINRLEVLELKRTEAKSILCNDLFDFISNSKSANDQNNLLNLRRDIYNNRKLKKSKIDRALLVLTPSLTTKLLDYLTLLEEIKRVEKEGEGIYINVTSDAKAILKDLASYPTFQKGLLLSSKSLLERISAYQKGKITRKREMQVESSLLQYLSRMYTKTSPFSTFTNLSLIHFDINNEVRKDNVDSATHFTSHIRLNNYLFKYISDLLKHYREAYLNFSLRTNPTIQRNEDHYLYLTNSNNIESFQRIPHSPLVSHIIEIVDLKEEGVKFDELITALQNDVDASSDELEDYINQLINYGLLEYNLGVSGIDPNWDVKLVKKLSSWADSVPFMSDLIEALKSLRSFAIKYEGADVFDRKRLLHEAFEVIREACFKIHEAARLPEDERKPLKELEKQWRETSTDESPQNNEGSATEEKNFEFKHRAVTIFTFKPEQIFYEDTTRQSAITFEQTEIAEVVHKFQQLLNHMRLLSPYQNEKDRMKAYFLEKYGMERKVDIITFYEDYFRDIKRPEKEQKEDYEKLEIESNKLRSQLLEDWKRSFIEELEKRELGTDEVHFGLGILEKVNDLNQFSDTGHRADSHGAFFQFYYDNDQLRAVLNSSFPGYGKMFSRFLHVFEEGLTSELKASNERLGNERTVMLENCDASYFNANLHPPLMPYEVWMPGGHNSLAEDKQIPITDFAVSYNLTNESLELIQKTTNKKLYIFDLGFQGQSGRSQLFQLLEKFTPTEQVNPNIIINYINQLIEKQQHDSEIKVYPRIVFEERLVLQRKTWGIPKELLPFRQPLDTDWDYFKRVNLWRKGQEIPQEVFVHVNQDRFGKNKDIDEEARKKITKDDYKPQYIDFRNPLFVNLLEKLFKKVPLNLRVVEILPSSSQMLRVDNERFVTEFVVQWYTNN